MAVVTRRTGLRADVIRAWERRHHAVQPRRSEGNRRLYSDDDIRRLSLLRRAVDAGWQISHVAHLRNAEIEGLIGEKAEKPLPPPPVTSNPARIDHHLERCLALTAELDGEMLARQLETASVELSRVDLLDRLLVPMMKRIGQGCSDGSLRTAHEHLASVVMRSFLDGMRGAYPANDSDPGIIVTTPVFQHHELAALLVAATARSEGWRTTYLGPNLPAEEIAAAVRQRRASILALSITFPADDPQLGDELKRIGRLLDGEAKLIVGGRSARGYSAALNEIGAVRLNNLAELRRYLNEIRVHSQPSSGAGATRIR
jgi:DNA-binding transcriptional MerR regulator/methylmalonyl-CoA mutase cobalamin-binding subunit